MISKQELQKPRTTSQLQQYVNKVFSDIRTDPYVLKEARLKKGLFKKLVEELYPLSIFSIFKYPDDGAICEFKIGNQGYDAIATKISNGEKEYIEITWPIDGHRQAQVSRLLNDRRYTELEISDDFSKERKETIDRVLGVAKNKALKDYTFPGRSSLIFLIDVFPYFYLDNRQHCLEIEYLMYELTQIDFRVDSVYLILMPYKRVVPIEEG
jgi:hypothetical protein